MSRSDPFYNEEKEYCPLCGEELTDEEEYDMICSHCSETFHSEEE